MTDEDINAMALYMLDHPKGKMTMSNYYAAFQAQVSFQFSTCMSLTCTRQYTGSSRSLNSWTRVIRTHELKITSRMNAILDERNGVSTQIVFDTPSAPVLVNENRRDRSLST